MKKGLYILISILPLFLLSCNEKEENVDYNGKSEALSTDPIDIYFQDNFQDKYNCAIRWRWIENYIGIEYLVAPAKRDVAIPTGEMLVNFWIEPYIELGRAGGDFIRNNFPPEIVFIGSELRNADGTVTLGYAEAGVRITLTELNQFDLSNKAWIIRQLETIHHEFTHTIHQKYNMPTGFNEVTPDNYTANSWVNVDESKKEHIIRGMVSAYGTNSEFEDLCEIVAKFLLTDPEIFEATFITPVAGETELNKGKAFIAAKLEIVKAYYQQNFSIDIIKLRDIIVYRLNKPVA